MDAKNIPMAELRAAWNQYQKTGIVPGTTELNLLKKQNAAKAKKNFRVEKKIESVIERTRIRVNADKDSFFMKLFWRFHIWNPAFGKDLMVLMDNKPKNFLGIYYIPCKK